MGKIFNGVATDYEFDFQKMKQLVPNLNEQNINNIHKNVIERLRQQSVYVNAGGKGYYSPYSNNEEWSDDVDLLLSIYTEQKKIIRKLNNTIYNANKSILNFLLTEEYINIDGHAISNNYSELMSILGTPNNEEDLKSAYLTSIDQADFQKRIHNLMSRLRHDLEDSNGGVKND